MEVKRYSGLLRQLYGDDGSVIEQRLISLVSSYRGRITPPADSELTQHDAMLITYGDQVQQPGQSHLSTLSDFCENHLKDYISNIHILPFYPWSSDDGFSVKDYRSVDPSLGTWNDVENLGHSFRLMFDAVINHISAGSDWFQAFLKDHPPYNRYFIAIEGNPDLSRVIRPRALPLLTEFKTASGSRKVWTTFSTDQVDLNYSNPDVLLQIIYILLEYAKRGAQFIRLDAIAFLWKEIGTTCLHLPQTHAVVQLLRAILDDVAPHVRIITETNVPHNENVSYFGDGGNEAHLVYNFALPPLVLHTLQTGDATALSQWASNLSLPSKSVTFFNFLASHDGIGLNPVRGILTDDQINNLVQRTMTHGGLISYKNNPDGSQSPYEMNINYFDALSNPAGVEPLEMQIDRFMASQAILLMFRGIPGIYFHSLFGSRGWREGVEKTGHNRTINRQKLILSSLDHELNNPESIRAQVFSRYCDLLSRRASSPAFHPQGKQEILEMGSDVFAMQRTSPDGQHRALFLQNISANVVRTGGYELEPYQTLIT